MKKVFVFFACFVFATGCSEGDIIDDDINFTANLNNCFNENDFVFFKIDTEINRAISLSFTNATFGLTTVPTDLTVPTTITLNGTTNALSYRQFNTAIDDTYFCASVPAPNITVTRELLSANGTVQINYAVKTETATETVYTRTFVINNITLEGEDISLRKEVFDLGSDEFAIEK